SAGPLVFPIPGSFTTAGFAGYGHEGTVLHPVKIEVPTSAAIGSTITLRARANWLACDPKSCVPGQA
ncbi:MAG: hypothetical protein GWO24_07285, partial [Akkermansiaceae bacterium]|nr:hypothetical protein [Akkermansiaceae bacterium]